MICRNMINGTVVFFNSAGKEKDRFFKFEDDEWIEIENEPDEYYIAFSQSDFNRFNDGFVKLIGKSIKAENYGKNLDAIVNSLNQRLSVIKGELWYDVHNGLPLFEKKLNKIILDSYIAEVIYSNENVIDILKYESKIEKNKFYCDLSIQTVYGDVNFVI